MSCNLEIHTELKKEYCICPFCDKTIDEVKSVIYDCCENPIYIIFVKIPALFMEIEL